MLEILRDEFAFQVLPAAGERYDALIERIRGFLVKRAIEDFDSEAIGLDHKTEDKCRRDALLFGAVKAQRDLVVSGVSGRAVVVSSARLMKEAEEVFKGDLGRPDTVVSVPAVGCLLTLVPGVHMGLGTPPGSALRPWPCVEAECDPAIRLPNDRRGR